MLAGASADVTRELSRRTRSDFERVRKFRDRVGDHVEWRIACFVVRKDRRRRGAAAVALAAALAAIRERGGGLVEAHPIVVSPSAADTRLPPGNHFGTESMFRKQGFEAVDSLGSTHVLMRRAVSR